MQTESGRYVWPVSLKLVKLVGEDAASWFQTQSTQDVRKIDSDGSRYCLVQQNGRVADYGVAYLHEDELYLAMHKPELIEERIEQFVIMEDVRAETLELSGFQTIGGAVEGVELSFPDDWIDDTGTLTFCESIEQIAGFEPLSKEIVEFNDLMAMRPNIWKDVDDKTFPQELGKRFESEHVSYTKGCYLGQEVVHRIMARGRVNRTLRFFTSEGRLGEGDLIFQGETKVGQIARSATDGSLYVGSGLMKNSLDASQPVRTESGVELTLLDG